MSMIKKKKRCMFFILLFIIVLSVSVLAEYAAVYWYDAGGTICDATDLGAVPTDPNQKLYGYYSDSAPLCCDVQGWVQVEFYTTYGHAIKINAYYCNCIDGSTQSQGCGLCGTQSRTCSGGNWGSWGSCTGQGVCSPGQVQSQGCGNCGTQTRTCTGSCAWGSWGSCTGEGCLPGSKQCSGLWVQTCSASCAWTNTQNCDAQDGCSGNVYRDYYCSASSCTFTPLDSDASVTYCNCLGAGYWQIGGEVAATTCCTDDGGEFVKTQTNYPGQSGELAVDWISGVRRCCDTPSDHVDYNGNCVPSIDSYGNAVATGSSGHDKYAAKVSWYGWLDCDRIDGPAGWCKNICGAGTSVPVGESGVGEYPVGSCCGDDSEEYYEYFKIYPSNPAEPLGKRGGDKSADNACCNNAYDCVYNRQCYNTNAYYDLDGDGRKDYFCYPSQEPSWWINVDYHTSYCTANGYGWNIGGDARVEEEYYTTTGSRPDYCTIGTDGHPSTECCCGDDSGESYRTREIYHADEVAGLGFNSDSNDNACCDAANDCVYNSVCYTGGQYSDLDGDGLKEAFCYPAADGPGKWISTDYHPSYCTTNGYYWNVGGDANVDNAYNPTYSGYIYPYPEGCKNHPNYASTRCCCGDDAGEYYTTQGMPGSAACCDNANDCVDRNNRCQNEYGEETICNDGFDNDCDGLTDCSDPHCVSVCLPDCTPEVCTGGIDEDCDHYVDCADNDCIGPPSCPDCSAEVCTGGDDEDCDGKIDCADNDCIGSPDCQTCRPDGGLAVPEIYDNGNCDNGKDDDCDGLIDNADWDCPGCPKGTALCNDGKTCSIWCTKGVLGCVGPPDEKCTEGEGCACADCKNKRDSCEKGLICDAVQQFCSCPVGTQICSDGSCKKICNVCGMNGLEPGEECDGSILPTGIQTCGALGLTGTIGCTNCFITGCTDGSKNCGDGAIQTDESCDGTNLAAKTCSTFGFAKGTISCFAKGTANECHFDTSNCYNENSNCEDDDKCDTAGGEDCTCLDCLGEQAPCGFGQVCDETARCKCEDGTTLCGDGTCKLSTDCQTFPECDGDGVCEIGESCSCSSGSGCVNNICNDCNGKSDTCKSSSTCVNGLCTTCSILKAYWSEDCIGSDIKDGVSMVVEGASGCEGKTITLHLWEDDILDDDFVKDFSAMFKNGKIGFKWTPEFPDNLINEGCPFCDAKKSSDNPPEKFLEYYFIAEIGGEKVISEILNVHYCIPDCDADCDTYVDKDLQTKPACTSALASDPAYGQYGGSLKIDSNPKSGYCEDCSPDGLSPGQETCAAYYDCTPDWWTKPGETETPSQSHGELLQDISSVLEWSECDEASKIRTRKICYDSSSTDCCKVQDNCYCKIPSAEIIQQYDCDSPDFRPTEIKACLAEEKFSFFTNMNILIVVLILIGFYIWKNREQEKTKTKRRSKIKH